MEAGPWTGRPLAYAGAYFPELVYGTSAHIPDPTGHRQFDSSGQEAGHWKPCFSHYCTQDRLFPLDGAKNNPWIRSHAVYPQIAICELYRGTLRHLPRQHFGTSEITWIGFLAPGKCMHGIVTTLDVSRIPRTVVFFSRCATGFQSGH